MDPSALTTTTTTTKTNRSGSIDSMSDDSVTTTSTTDRFPSAYDNSICYRMMWGANGPKYVGAKCLGEANGFRKSNKDNSNN